MSKYITKSIKTVSDKINQTKLDKRNEKIILKDASEEIYNLVNAYNDMVDELGESAVKLAKSEPRTGLGERWQSKLLTKLKIH